MIIKVILRNARNINKDIYIYMYIYIYVCVCVCCAFVGLDNKIVNIYLLCLVLQCSYLKNVIIKKYTTQYVCTENERPFVISAQYTEQKE